MIVAKVTLVLAIALIAARLLRSASAATRHAVLVAGLLSTLALPLLKVTLPALPVDARIGDDFTIPALLAAKPAPRTVNVLVPLWVIGSLIVVACRLRSYTRAWLVVHDSQPCDDFRIAELGQPATFGNAILLPRAALTWPDALRRIVLLHERAHVARRDTLWQLAGDVVSAVYWFHPLAWIAARQAALERERACDDRVVATGVSTVDYAAALVDVARRVGRGGLALAIAEPTHLGTRVRALIDPGTPRQTTRGTLAVIVVSVAIALPAFAAVEAFRRPLSMEPDRLGDAVSMPSSERFDWQPTAVGDTTPTRDAELIDVLRTHAARPAEDAVDLVPERSRWALAQIRNGELVPPMIEKLDDPDWRVRAYAAWTLGVSRDPRATRALVAQLEHPIWRVRAMTASALAMIGDRAAEKAMLARIDDPAWQVRSSVVRYLRVIGGHERTVEQMSRDRHIAVRLETLSF